MYIILIVIHVIVCLVLISVILLQAGRGGGLTEAFGGDTAQSVLGAQAPTMLKKATEGCAIAFLVMSLLLAMLAARRGRSLMDRVNLQGAMQKAKESTSQPVVIPPVEKEASVDVAVPSEESVQQPDTEPQTFPVEETI